MVPAPAHTQAGVLLLKKKGRTIKRFYTGKNFSFYTTDGMPVHGRLDSTVRDSIFLTYFQEERVPTQWGTYTTQVHGTFDLKFSMANVGSLPRDKRSGLLPGILILGGAGFTVVNIINTVREGDAPFGKDNIAYVLSGLAAVATGTLMLTAQPTKYELGKKYTLEAVQ